MSISDPHAAVVEDIRRIRHHPLVAGAVVIHGFLYDIMTGRLLELEEASRVGQLLGKR